MLLYCDDYPQGEPTLFTSRRSVTSHNKHVQQAQDLATVSASDVDA